MTCVNGQKLCVNIYIYIYIYIYILSEYRTQHGAIGPFYVTSSYSTWIFCRGVSGFATDRPCDVWCRGLTTCLLHVGPAFGNLFLSTNWAVGLTYWIVYLHFVYFDICNYICLDASYHFSALSLLSKYSLFFSSTPVITFSINVVFVLSMQTHNATMTFCFHNRRPFFAMPIGMSYLDKWAMVINGLKGISSSISVIFWSSAPNRIDTRYPFLRDIHWLEGLIWKSAGSLNDVIQTFL